jgi:DNA-binding NarL/FixJ family response regulator
VVDDHSVTRHGVVLLCENPEGVEVIARVAELLPDVVLLDVDIPKRDGICAIRQIRQDDPSVGVVLPTVHEDQESHLADPVRCPSGGTTTPGRWPGCRRPEG